jgi:hypothetical protein
LDNKKDIPLAEKLFNINSDQQVSCFSDAGIGGLLLKILDVEKAGHTIFSICHDGKNFIAFVRRSNQNTIPEKKEEVE